MSARGERAYDQAVARSRAAWVLTLATFVVCPIAGARGDEQPYLVRDITPGARDISPLPASRGWDVFGAPDGIWITDGTPAATRLIDSLRPCRIGWTCGLARYQGAVRGNEVAVLVDRDAAEGEYTSLRVVDVDLWSGRQLDARVGGFCANALRRQTDGLLGLATTILIAAPVYNYDVGAAVKNLIEHTGDAWTDKTVGFMLAAGMSIPIILVCIAIPSLVALAAFVLIRDASSQLVLQQETDLRADPLHV